MIAIEGRINTRGLAEAIATQAGRATPLGVLRDVEVVVTALGKHQYAIAFFLQIGERALALVRAEKDPAVFAEQEGDSVPAFEEAEALMARWLDILKNGRQSALADPALREGHEETVVTEFCTLIDMVADLLNLMVELRWAIMEQASAAEDTSDLQVFHRPEELIAELQS